MPWGLLVLVLVLALLCGADAGDPRLQPAPPPASAGLLVSPAFQRIDLAAGAVAEVQISLVSAQAASLNAIRIDCACLAAITKAPLALEAGTPVTLRFRVTGTLQGVKPVRLITSLGSVEAQIQVVTPGLGSGAAVLKDAIAEAQREGLGLWVLVHDLRGELRNCGCSGGSLGGADVLAALPARLREVAPGLAVRCLLSGDSDGPHAGLGAALQSRAWTRDDLAVRIAADPVPLLAEPGVVAIISDAVQAPQHQRIVRPVLTGGLTAELLLVDAQGRIRFHHTLPIDRTLPTDASILAAFPGRLSAQVVADAQPAQACAACHANAHSTWLASRHAKAWESLAPADRIDACASCHATPLPPAADGQARLAPGVACQACHVGADAHAANVTVKPPAATDCRSCHDAKHHPAFDRARGWAVIAHTK